MNSVWSNNISLKYLRFTSQGCKNIGIRKIEFVAKTQIHIKKIWTFTPDKRALHLHVFLLFITVGCLIMYNFIKSLINKVCVMMRIRDKCIIRLITVNNLVCEQKSEIRMHQRWMHHNVHQVLKGLSTKC